MIAGSSIDKCETYIRVRSAGAQKALRTGKCAR